MLFRSETTRAWEHEAAHQLREQHAVKSGSIAYVPCDDISPLWEVEVRAYHPRPKTRPAHIPKVLWSLLTYRLHATSRHDLDNIVKSTLDAMQIARVVSNDRCIVSIMAGSYYAFVDERPRVEVVMREVSL